MIKANIPMKALQAKQKTAETQRINFLEEDAEHAATIETWRREYNEASALAKQTGGNHYKQMKIQPVEYVELNELSFLEGCVIKYISRWRHKNGLEDLRKIQHCVDLLIELNDLEDSK